MKSVLSLILILLIMISCKKNSIRENDKDTPSELVGKWVRGEFNMSDFEQYNGQSIMHSSLTTGALDIRADGTIYNYSVFFPTDPKGGCNPQVLTLYEGKTDFTIAGRMKMDFDSGTERIFYQQCTGKTNTQRVLGSGDFTGLLTVFWTVETLNGKTVLAISYSDPANPKILLEKKDW